MRAKDRHELGRLLTVDEVADVCCVSIRTVRRWIANGDLTAHRLGRQLRVSIRDLERFFEASRE